MTHFRTKYDGRLPTWVVTELLDFGGLSVLYQGLATSDRKRIAAELGVTDAKGGNGPGVANWMHLMNYVRNVCAHHSRFWNQNMARQVAPKALRSIDSLSHVAGLAEADLARPYPRQLRGGLHVAAGRPRCNLGLSPDRAGAESTTSLAQASVRDGHAARLGRPASGA